MPVFSARDARALALRTVGVAEILADMKQAVMEAAAQGEFEACVMLPEPNLVLPGRSTNTAAFLVEHFTERELPTWAEAVKLAVQAGYSVVPVWLPLENGPGCAGVQLAWSMVSDKPDRPPMLMSAWEAFQLSYSASAQQRWIEKAFEAIRRAASRGATSCTLNDSVSVDSPVWQPRRAELKNAGFTVELVATRFGSQLVTRW